MQNKMLLVGATVFGIGVLLMLSLLFSSGGAAKSRQIGVLGELFSGRLGGTLQALSFAALGAIAVGALICFGAAGRGDGDRRKACQNACAERGYEKGRLGLSESRDAAGRPLKVCRCSGGPEKDIEIDPATLASPK